MPGFRDEMWCRYNKNHDPRNPFFCSDICIDLFPHDGKKYQFINIPCPFFPIQDHDAFEVEIDKALDKISFKGDRNKIKYV